MANQRTRLNPKSKPITSVPDPLRPAIFGPPPLLPGEDAAVYDAFYARICAAVNPTDILEEILVNDVASLEWEVLRWRRWKLSLIETRGLAALEEFLSSELADNHFDLYAKDFVEVLTDTLQENFEEGQTEDSAQELAHRTAQNDPEAVDKVNTILAAAEMSMSDILNRAQSIRVEKLALGYARRQPQAVKLVDKVLDGAGRTMDGLISETMAVKLDDIERIDRNTAIAETRRNASLREIDRRRAMLGQALRRSVQEIEDGEFEVVKLAPAQGETRDQ
jgi:hypothetical protein